MPDPSTACDELLEEVTQLRNDLATYVLSGEGKMWTLPMVLDELCRILADEPPDVSGLDSHDPADALIEEGRFDG